MQAGEAEQLQPAPHADRDVADVDEGAEPIAAQLDLMRIGVERVGGAVVCDQRSWPFLLRVWLSKTGKGLAEKGRDFALTWEPSNCGDAGRLRRRRGSGRLPLPHPLRQRQSTIVPPLTTAADVCGGLRRSKRFTAAVFWGGFFCDVSGQLCHVSPGRFSTNRLGFMWRSFGFS